MLVGNGLIAGAFGEFRDDGSVLVIAAGVSNSKETRDEQFDRELTMIEKHLSSGARLVYFGTCSIFDPELSNSQYILHKRHIEEQILRGNSSNLVLRLPNVVGPSKNPFILFNYLVHHIRNEIPFNLHTNARRYLLSIDEVTRICGNIIRSTNESGAYNVCIEPSYDIRSIVEEIEAQLGKTAVFKEVETGAGYQVNNRSTLPFIPDDLLNEPPGQRLSRIVKAGLKIGENE